jgi:hypothetical protein
MSAFTRVEFSVAPNLKSLRVVLLIEFPEEVLRQLKNGKTSSEMEGHRIALEAIHALHFGSARGNVTFISSTPGKIKKRESLGEPHYAAADGCRAWIIRKP